MAAGGKVEGTARDINFIFSGPEYAVNSRYGRSEHGTGGVRLGVWSNDERWKWFGAAIDLSYFKIDDSASNTSIWVSPFSVMGLFRYPMMHSSDYPGGRTQPYAGMGLVALLGYIETDATRPDGTTGQVGVGARGAGVDLHAGWSFKLSTKIGVFAEYRYLYGKLEGDTEDEDFAFFPDSVVELETTLSVHQILSGFFVTF